MKTVAIIGAGPAGLAAAYVLLSQSEEYQIMRIDCYMISPIENTFY